MSLVVNAVARLVVDIVGNRFSVPLEIKKVAEEILKQLIKYGIKITVQAIEEFITKVQLSKEQAYNKSKDLIYEMLESTKATAGFTGRLFEAVVSFGVNCLRNAVGNITGQQLFNRTCHSVDTIVHSSAKPLAGAAAGVIAGVGVGIIAGAGVGVVAGAGVGIVVGAGVGVIADVQGFGTSLGSHLVVALIDHVGVAGCKKHNAMRRLVNE